MRRVLAGVLIALALAIAGCGSSESAHNEKAKKEQEICFEQAEELAGSKGAAAGGEHLDDCVQNYANELQVEE